MKKSLNTKLLIATLFGTLSLITACVGNSSSSTATQTPNTITFSPSVINLNNPIALSSSTQPQIITLQINAIDANGQTIEPSANNPLHFNVYGAPLGVITPESGLSVTNTITFTYNGDSFPNNILLNAWIKNAPDSESSALGVTQILMQNTPTSCITGTESYPVTLTTTLPDALQIQASIGANPSLQTLHNYTLDTGSLGTIVPATELPTDGSAIGPGAYGTKYYNSSGNTYSGHYYLTQVNIKSGNDIISSQPVMVLAIESAYCSGPRTATCLQNPPTLDFRYLGVGFNRNSTESTDLFVSPSANPFLHLTNIQRGTNITPGYYLTPGESASPGLVLGITDTSQYSLINLTKSTTVAGDYNSQPGCYSFPNIANATYCGTALLDIGISEMFIDLAENLWPTAAVVKTSTGSYVPPDTDMTISMGATNNPAMSYSYTYTLPPPSHSPAPSYAQWINSTNIFVNTGRRALYNYNYLYNGQCGQVGFQALP